MLVTTDEACRFGACTLTVSCARASKEAIYMDRKSRSVGETSMEELGTS